uniref:Uncharacterized protein n=1 Tax=Glycine max TaxID=3847 RepID=A0A0R0JCQ0_SOYBN
MFSPLARVVRLAQVLACALSVGNALSAPWVGPDAKSSTFLHEFPNVSSSKLLLIDLSSNKLQVPIPISIFHIRGLHFLQLSDNELNGAIQLDMVQRLHNLHTLGLSHNKLSIDVTLDNDHDLSSFHSIEYILLASCTLKEFTGFLRNLANNQIEGKIPNWIWRFDSLVYLNLSNNFLTNMERPIDDLNSNLYILHSNQLTGLVPTFTKYVVHLDYSSNRFSTAPLGMDNFNDFIHVCLMERNSTLRVLNLTGNKLKGYLSDTTSSSCNSRSNKLNGPIACPHNTSSWEMLHIVDLDYNNFIGILPGPFFKSWTKMIGREAENHEKYGTLLFDMFDNLENMRYNNLLSVINKFLVTKLYKLLATEPYSVADHMFAYYITNNEFGGRYLDSVTVVNKALQMNFIKIPTIFTSMDLSSYHFEGPKSQEVVSLRALNALNLSHNAFSTYLNLAFNHLWGEIPTGAQMQTFDLTSFEGNEGLCGSPIKDCTNDSVRQSLPTPLYEMHGSIDWNFQSVELGFIFGFGIFILPLMFLKRWGLFYWQHVDDLLYMLVPQFGFVYEQHRGQRYRALRWIV